MYKKDLQKKMGQNLEEIRRALNLNSRQMSDILKVTRSTYRRNEEGDTFPGIWSVYILAVNRKISLDWLFCNRGEKFYKDSPTGGTTAGTESGEKGKGKLGQTVFTGELGKEVNELIEHMDKDPQLRYEVLALFHKFKKESGKST
jgi:transcriptional regulator with XRE-family HTH domain